MGDSLGDATATAVRKTLLRCLAEEPKTREPMNALVAWTELGRGLSGTLEDVSGDRGLLRKLIYEYGHDHAATIDLSRWLYRLEGKERLDAEEIASALRRIEDALEDVLAAHLEKAELSPDARRALFVAVVKGWFPVGLDIMHALPAGSLASDEALLGALTAWCERHLSSAAPLPDEAAKAPEATKPSPKVRLRVL
jgi:hypothetical protein